MSNEFLCILLFFSLPFLILPIDNVDWDDMVKRENDTYLKYYFENNSTPFDNSDSSFSIQNDSINKARRISLLSTLNEYYPDWMSGLSDSRRLDTITIPGTHDTCSRYGGPLLKCQDLTLEEQLLMGVRLIDIRCRHINDVFMIHHNRVYQRLSFGSGVRDVCVRFLQNHPKEVIFMLIQEEWKPKDNTRTFDETMYSYINCSEYKKYFYLNEGELPTIESVRGKIVIFRRFNKEKLSEIDMGNYIKFAVNDEFVSNTTITAYGQDRYKVPSLFDRPKKYKFVESFFEKPKSFEKRLTNHIGTTIFFNYGSGQSYFCYPYYVAEYINPRIGNYVEKSYPNEFLGMIFLDFVNRYHPKIIYHIIKRNFIPEKNGGLKNVFTVCDLKNCTNKSDGTNKLCVALVIITVLALFALVVIFVIYLVKRFNKKEMNSEKDAFMSLLKFQFIILL